MRSTPPARPARARRPRGRPARSGARGGRDAREALLDAAVALIAERGVAATTAAEIAALAGVTPALVHYYFRGRPRLLDAVVDERLSRFAVHVFAPAPTRPASLAEAMATLVGRIFDAARRMPWMPPIWIREIAPEGGLLRKRALALLPTGAIGGVGDLLAAAQRRGEIGPDIEPRIVFVSIMGLTMFPLATRGVWRRLPGAERITVGDLQRHATALLATGLAGPRAGAHTRIRRRSG
jgi:AcrR family transcriptional regulator